MTMQVRPSFASCARLAVKPNSSVPTYATRTMCATWSIEPSGASGCLDAAVNIAGTEGQPGPVTQQTADSYAATFDTNVLGTLLS